MHTIKKQLKQALMNLLEMKNKAYFMEKSKKYS